MTLKTDFLAIASLKSGTVKVEGLEVSIREMDLATRGEMMGIIKSKEGSNEQVSALILSRCVPALESPTPEEVNAISPVVAAIIADAVLDLSGLKADAVEEATGN